MAPRARADLTILLLLLLLLLAAATSNAASITPQESFMRCFSNITSASQSPQLVYAPNTAAYNTVLQSSVRNARFLDSSTNKKPTLIVTATSQSHVQASVICCKRFGLELRVRSGGHDYEGTSYVSDVETFITVDLANLRTITVNAVDNTAWVQAGATVGELYYRINENNKTRGFPAGTCATIGIGGHFSGGGIGTLVRKYGTSADQIIDALLVDVNGRVLNRKTMGEDLFWAIRGGGAASFGVVLSYRVNLVYVPPIVTTFNIFKTLRQNATKLVARWQNIINSFDENLFIRVVAQAIDDPQSGRTIQALFQSFFLGRRDQLLAVMNKSFPELGLKAEDCSEVSWLDSVLFFNWDVGKPKEILLDRTPHFDRSSKGKSDYVTQPITESQWEGIWNFLKNAKDQPLNMIMEPMGGRMNAISETAIPYPHRKGTLYNIQYFMSWSEKDSAVIDKHLQWMRSIYSFMTPYVSSNPRAAYVNYKDLDLGRNLKGNTSYTAARGWGERYFKGNFKRLANIKANVDPGNFFRNEQSIPPLISKLVADMK